MTDKKKRIDNMDGNDWLFTQHQKIDTIPTEDDFSDMLSIADSNIYIYNRAKKDYNSSSKRYFK